MAANTIVDRVEDFLHQHAPFDQVSANNLRELAATIEIRYYREGERIFTEGEQPPPFFYMVRKGSVALYRESPTARELTDECDEGDIFGVRPLFANDRYLMTAEAAEESLLYAFPREVAQQLLRRNPGVGLHFASVFASSLPQRERRVRDAATSASQVRTSENYLMRVVAGRRVIHCAPHTRIADAARQMTAEGVGSILITDDERRPLGIITDTDLRRYVVAAETDIRSQPVADIMSSPVITTVAEQTVAEAMLVMIRHHVHHLCITEDGTAQTAARAMISDHDLLLTQGDHPAVLVVEMQQANESVRLRSLCDKAANLVQDYLQKEVSVEFVANVSSEINDALILRLVAMHLQAMADEGYERPPGPFCWLSLGSEGRKEQLLRTDQDNALIYADDAGEPARAFYLELAQRVTQGMHHCGFALCPADMMASNPQWCQPLGQWQRYFSDWIRTPDASALLRASIFFDFRPVFGDFALADTLKQTIFKAMAQTRGFLPFLAKNALQNPPPLSFFRGFMVEKNGAHKDEFDIKARTLMPLTDAARVLAYDQQLPQYLSTIERFRKVGQADPTLADVCGEAAEAYGALLRFRAMAGLQRQDSGRYLNPEKLNKLDRQRLRSIFQIIERVQAALTSRYRLDFLR